MTTDNIAPMSKELEQVLTKTLAEGLVKKLKSENVVSCFDGLKWEEGHVNADWVETDCFNNSDGDEVAEIDINVNILFSFEPVDGFTPTHAIMSGDITFGDCYEDKATGEYLWVAAENSYILNYGYYSNNLVWGNSYEMESNYTEGYEHGMDEQRDDEIGLAVINKAWELLDPVVKAEYLQAVFDTACKSHLKC